MNSREAQFQELFQRHADEIFRFVYFRVFERELARDLVQETFLRAWQYESKKVVWNERALLFKIARNLVIDQQRKNKDNNSLDELTERQGEEPATAEDLTVGIDSKIFFKNLEQLKPEEQELIQLRYLDGFSPRVIAKMLERNVGVVSVQLNRAKKKLKQIYENSIPKN